MQCTCITKAMNMKYLIIHTDPTTGEQCAFFTHWYQYENHFQPGMIVVDRTQGLITFDGETWQDIEEDSL